MTFINEHISEDDRKKYGIEPGGFYQVAVGSWTVDKESDSFLVQRTGSGPEGSDNIKWAFRWHGHLLDVSMDLLGAGSDASEKHGWQRTKIRRIDGIPAELVNKRQDIVSDLKAALTARKGLGIYSDYTSYEVFLEEGGQE